MKKTITILFTLIFVVIGSIFVIRSFTSPSTSKPPINNLTTTAFPTVAFEKDEKSGCVFSLRFDKDGKADENLKEEARKELQTLAKLIGEGKTGEEMLSLILSSNAISNNPEALKAYFDERAKTGTAPTFPPNKYEKFNVLNTPNFCFANSDERHLQLGQIFYEVNPAFQETFKSLNEKEVSTPMVLYTLSTDGPKEYAWSIVVRSK